MKKLSTFLKTLLVAVGIGVGSSVWADNVASYNFNDQTTPFVISDAARLSVTYPEHVSEGGDHYAKYSCGNMNAVAFAYYDFSSNVTDAETVTLEFDFNVTQVAGHEIISLADANYHTASKGGFSGKSNTGYGSNGTIFNFGCWRANDNNRFAINGSQKSADVTTQCLGAWCHASITINNATQKVSYTIKNADLTQTYLDGTDIAFLNASAQRCSQIDVYIGTNGSGNAVQIDNLVITKTVSGTSHTYTIKAFDGETEVATIASGTATEGASFSANIPKCVKDATGKCYILDDGSNQNLNNYFSFYTMGTANADKTINYTLDESIIYYGEAETIGDGSNSSNESHLSQGGGQYKQATSGSVTLPFTLKNDGIYDVKVGMYNSNSSNRGFTYSINSAAASETITVNSKTSYILEVNDQSLPKGNNNIKLSVTNNLTPVFDYLIIDRKYVVGSATPSISNGAYVPLTLSTMTFTFSDAYTSEEASFAVLNSATAKLYNSSNEEIATGTLSVSGNVVTADFDNYALSAGSTYTITLPAEAVGYDGQISNSATSITVHTCAVTDGTYYLKNKATGAYFAAGLSWGTQAITNSIGHYVTVNSVLPAGTYTLNTHIYKSDSNHFLGSDFFCDGASYEWTIESAGEGYYTISNENGTITAGASGEALSLTSGTGDNTKWTLLTEAEWKAEQVARLDAATANNGVDATFYLPAANFNRCDDDENAKWQGSPAISGLGNNTASTNFNAEKFTDPYATFDVYQALTGVKPGVYKLTAQGFYRNGLDNATDANDNLALLYANSTTVPLVNIRSTGFTDNSHSEEGFSTDKSGYYVPDSQGDASKAFNAGYYQNELNAFVDEDGALRIGVKKEAATGADKDWTCFDNLQLTYYGEAIVNVATAFTNGASMTAGQWYYYDIPYGGVYFLAAESDLDDIVYATDGTLAVGIDGSSFASNTPTLTVIRYYIKSASTQKLSISPKEVESVFDFEDGNNLFTAYNSSKITVSNEASGPSDWTGGRVQKFVYKGKGAHNFAYYSFADLTSSASEVTVDFDFYVTQGAGQNLISIADANYHTGALGGFTSGSNSGYGANGAIFNLGCIRKGSGNNATNYFGVNTTQDTELGATGLSAWCHATITANNVTRKVTYVIKNASDETIKSGTVDYLNENGLNCTQIDVYTGATSADSPIYIDNLSITSTVNSVSATLGTNGYGTFASPYPLDLAHLPEGLTAYKASTISGKTVTFTAVTEAVQANTGLLLKGDAGESETIVSIPVAASGDDISETNQFQVNTAGTTFTGDADYYYFGLKKNTLTFGLFDPSTVAIPANKAYLKVLKSSVDASRSLSIVFDDEATAVYDLNDKSEMINDKWYDLQGRRVTHPTKGLYIVNGRKVVVK